MSAQHMTFVTNDGGRAEAGYKGTAGDCVCRAICIASGLPYSDVYAVLANGTHDQRVTKRSGQRAKTARNGINTKRKWFKDYMASIGFVWTPTMLVGQGCKTHLVQGELPSGKLVVSVSKHYTAVVDGVVHDTFDPQRCTVEVGVKDGTPYRTESERCVYGYWTFGGAA